MVDALEWNMHIEVTMLLGAGASSARTVIALDLGICLVEPSEVHTLLIKVPPLPRVA